MGSRRTKEDGEQLPTFQKEENKENEKSLRTTTVSKNGIPFDGLLNVHSLGLKTIEEY